MFGDAGSIGVVGLYVGIVYALGMSLRAVFDRYSEVVIYEELPDTEKLREIIEGIDISQAEGDLRTEKNLFDMLVAIYRNPQLMLKITGLKQKYVPEQNELEEGVELNSIE